MITAHRGDGAEEADWVLLSGTWRSIPAEHGFELISSAAGRSCAGRIPADDLRLLLGSSRCQAHPEALYPPEFRFCPTSGEVLVQPAQAVSTTWLPPFGQPSLGHFQPGSTRGLRQCFGPLRLAPRAAGQSAAPDGDLSAPPPGDYEFFSLHASTVQPALLALEPEKGQLFVHLPAQDRWEELRPATRVSLDAARIERSTWRCEVALMGAQAQLFVPTESGLACIEPDVPALVYAIRYVGDAPALAAPISFADWVWVPLQGGSPSELRLVAVDGAGAQVHELVLQFPKHQQPWRLRAPLADARAALWLCDQGQIVLRKRAAEGDFEAVLIPWPPGCEPRFEFGAPYLGRTGTPWQLCFDRTRGRYVYVHLGMEQPRMELTATPRACSGLINYRFASRIRNEPWLEPEFGDDSQADQVVLPLLEVVSDARSVERVFGLRMHTTESLGNVLQSRQPQRAVLVCDDMQQGQQAFFVFSGSEPWRLRLFAHGLHLWAFDRTKDRLHGWRLQA